MRTGVNHEALTSPWLIVGGRVRADAAHGLAELLVPQRAGCRSRSADLRRQGSELDPQGLSGQDRSRTVPVSGEALSEAIAHHSMGWKRDREGRCEDFHGFVVWVRNAALTTPNSPICARTLSPNASETCLDYCRDTSLACAPTCLGHKAGKRGCNQHR